MGISTLVPQGPLDAVRGDALLRGSILELLSLVVFTFRAPQYRQR